MGDFARYPFEREPWLDCPICGESFPRHMMQRHYKKGFLVDKLCADARAHDDQLAELIRGRERPDPSEQVVQKQGGRDLTLWPTVLIVVAGAGSGSTGGVVGSSSEGIVTVNTGTGPIAVSTVFILTFSVVFSTLPTVTFYPYNPTAMDFAVTNSTSSSTGVSISATTVSSFTVSSNQQPLAARATYQWRYTAHL